MSQPLVTLSNNPFTNRMAGDNKRKDRTTPVKSNCHPCQEPFQRHSDQRNHHLSTLPQAVGSSTCSPAKKRQCRRHPSERRRSQDYQELRKFLYDTTGRVDPLQPTGNNLEESGEEAEEEYKARRRASWADIFAASPFQNNKENPSSKILTRELISSKLKGVWSFQSSNSSSLDEEDEGDTGNQTFSDFKTDEGTNFFFKRSIRNLDIMNKKTKKQTIIGSSNKKETERHPEVVATQISPKKATWQLFDHDRPLKGNEFELSSKIEATWGFNRSGNCSGLEEKVDSARNNRSSSDFKIDEDTNLFSHSSMRALDFVQRKTRKQTVSNQNETDKSTLELFDHDRPRQPANLNNIHPSQTPETPRETAATIGREQPLTKKNHHHSAQESRRCDSFEGKGASKGSLSTSRKRAQSTPQHTSGSQEQHIESVDETRSRSHSKKNRSSSARSPHPSGRTETPSKDDSSLLPQTNSSIRRRRRSTRSESSKSSGKTTMSPVSHPPRRKRMEGAADHDASRRKRIGVTTDENDASQSQKLTLKHRSFDRRDASLQPVEESSRQRGRDPARRRRDDQRQRGRSVKERCLGGDEEQRPVPRSKSHSGSTLPLSLKSSFENVNSRPRRRSSRSRIAPLVPPDKKEAAKREYRRDRRHHKLKDNHQDAPTRNQVAGSAAQKSVPPDKRRRPKRVANDTERVNQEIVRVVEDGLIEDIDDGERRKTMSRHSSPRKERPKGRAYDI